MAKGMTQETRKVRMYNLLLAPIVVNVVGGAQAVSDWPPVIRVVADTMGKTSQHVTQLSLQGRIVARIERDVAAWWTEELPAAQK